MTGTTVPEICIRRARPEEADALCDLAVRAKAHWDYDAAFLADWRTALDITPAYIAACPVYVLEVARQVVGFYGLRAADSDGILDDLWIDPPWIGQGYGRQLWEHAVATARAGGWRALFMESEPYAEGFYRTMGAVPVGRVESAVRPGRLLPVLRYSLDGG